MKLHPMTVVLAAVGLAGCEPDNQATLGNNATPVANESLPGGGAAIPVGAAELRVASKEPYGEYLVDRSGRALYVLEDSRAGGSHSGQASSRCTGECYAEWPPFVTEGSPVAGPQVNGGMISTTPIEQGQQVTYAGWPLYYYRGDRSAGSTSGQEVHDSWGGWYLLSPDGDRIEGREMGPSAQ